MRSVLYAVAVALFALVNAPSGAAQLNAEKVKAAKQAADEFLVLAKDSEINGRVPREADPKVKRLLEIVFDRAALGSGVLPIEESAKISELINNANRVGFVYLLAGTGTTDLGTAKLMTAESARELQEQAVELAAAVKDPAVQSGLKTFAQTIAASAKP